MPVIETVSENVACQTLSRQCDKMLPSCSKAAALKKMMNIVEFCLGRWFEELLFILFRAS